MTILVTPPKKTFSLVMFLVTSLNSKNILARSDVSGVEKVDAFGYFVRGYESGESKPEQPRYEPVASYRVSEDRPLGLAISRDA